MLRLNPASLSVIFSNQLLADSAHLRPIFEHQLLPLISKRLLNMTLQRANSGSIGLGSALSLFLTAYKLSPAYIAEVGTYIGNSAASMALGAVLTGRPVKLITCDMNQCTQNPLEGIALPDGSAAEVVQGSSTKMLQALNAKNAKIDLFHIDGRLLQDDIKLLATVLKDETVIALDDCEGDEKGHMNLDLLRRANLLKHHVFIEPFPKEVFRTWNLETRSLTGFLIPTKQISYAWQ